MRSTSHPHTRKNQKQRALGIAMVVLFPVAVLGILLPANEYLSMGIVGAVDCDGPLLILVIAIPTLITYLIGFTVYFRLARLHKTAATIAMVVVSASICIALSGAIASALKEHFSTDHKEACGLSL